MELVWSFISSGAMTKRFRSTVSRCVSSFLIALKTLVNMGVTFESEGLGQLSKATKRLLGSGCHKFSSSSRFHHAVPADAANTERAARANCRRVQVTRG